MIINSHYQFKEDQSNEQLLTLQYKQFILDHKTIPSMEIINSKNISMMFLEKCYSTSLDQFNILSNKNKSLLFFSYKSGSLDLSKNLPKDVILTIFQLYFKVIEESNVSFKQFHELSFLYNKLKISFEISTYNEISTYFYSVGRKYHHEFMETTKIRHNEIRKILATDNEGDCIIS